MTSEIKINEIGIGSLVNVTIGNQTIDQRNGNKINSNNILNIDEKIMVAFSSKESAQKAINQESGIIKTNKAANQAAIFAIL